MTTVEEIEYGTDGHPYVVLDRETALRYARAAEDRYAGTDLPPPDLDQGPCHECEQQAHARWQHGHEQLCRRCRRRRDHATFEPNDPPTITSIGLPPFHGLCQRCIDHEEILLELVNGLFLCQQHARSRRTAITREARRKQAA